MTTNPAEEYADLGATTTEAMEIAETSMEIVRGFVRTAIDNHREDPRLLRLLRSLA